MKKTLLFLLLMPFALTAQDFWTEVSPFSGDYQHYVNEISIVNDEVVWVQSNGPWNEEPKWSRSLDGGVTWQEGFISLGAPLSGIASFHAVSADRAYVVAYPNTPGSYGGVWVTVDGGSTWTQQLGQDWISDTFPNLLHFWDENNGVVVCDPVGNGFQIYRTANAGVDWTLVPSANIPAPLTGEYGYTRCYKDNEGNFWFGTNKGRIYYSNANALGGGLNWQVYQTPIPDFGSAEQSGEFAFKNQVEGLMIDTDFNFWRTTDSGASWSQENPTGIYRNFTLTYVTGTNNSYFCTGEDAQELARGSAYTTDGGYNWIDLNDADTEPVFPEMVKFASGTVGFCVGRYLSDMGGPKHFFRMTDPMNRLLKTDNFAVDAKFTATPNPTSGLVKLTGRGINAVQVIDLTGKLVLTQNFDTLDEATIDIAPLQNGVYLAKINTATGGSATAKIIKQ